MTRNELDWEDEYSATKKPLLKRIAKYIAAGFISLLALLFFFYLIGMAIVHKIGDDKNFKVEGMLPNASRAVAITSALITREVDVNRWIANDPFFLPGYFLDNMPNFQQGLMYALSRFSLEMTDQIGRTRGSSEVDKDLDKAAGLLKYPGTIWIFDFSTSLAPTASSEAQYRAGRNALTAYNQRLASGSAVFERRADNLQATLLRFTADLGSSSAVIDQHLTKAESWSVDTHVDNIFYSTKGRLYGYYLILRELGSDFENVIKGRELGPSWQGMLESLRQAAVLDPVIVANGKPDGAFIPSHLASLGFYLLRARTQLREIINILQK